MNIAKQIGIAPGITALIGGGGKTSLLYRLAEDLKNSGTVLLCTTTRIFPPQHLPLYTGAETKEKLLSHLKEGPLCLGCVREDGKLGPALLSPWEMTQLADFVLVEADGSAGLPLKAHAAYEPVIPDGCGQVIALAGFTAFGKTVKEAAHRPALYAQQMNVREDEIVTPELAGRFLQAEGLADKVILNQMDDLAGLPQARRFAAKVSCPVWAGSIQKGELICLC